MGAAQHVQRVDHVGIVVPSVEAASRLYVDVLGGRFLSGGDNHTTGLRLVHLQYPGFKLELMESRRPDSLLASWLARSGPGLHHITFFVDDVLQTVDALAEASVTTVGTDASSPNWSETFIHPAEGFGALLQFVSSGRRWDLPETGFDLADVIAGRVHWKDYIPCRVDDGPTGSGDDEMRNL